MWRRLESRLRPSLIVRGPKKLYLYALFVGALTGLAGAAFSVALAYVERFAQQDLAGLAVPQPAGGFHLPPRPDLEPRLWVVFLLPIFGGLIAGLIAYLFAPEASGPGTDAMVDAFHNKEGRIRLRASFAKAFATLATLGGLGSAGKEGPLAQVGAGIGSWWAQFTGLGSRARRSLLLAGAAGGLGAVFHSPLGGALTAIEVLYKEDFESDAFVPSVIASVTGYAVMSSIMGGHRIFHLAMDPGVHHPAEILVYLVMGVLCFPLGRLYIYVYSNLQHKIFKRLPVPPYVVPMIGGVVVGLVALFFPQAVGTGFGFLQQVMDHGIGLSLWDAARLFATLAVLKIITTTCTVGAGASGGVFAPSLFIGGMLGGFVGTLGHAVFPEAVTSLTPYVLVGMGAFFGGVAHAPLASLIMVSEMSGGYGLLAPMMGVTMIAIMLNRGKSIYETQVATRFESPAHLWDMRPDVLRSKCLSDLEGELSRKAIVRHDTKLYMLAEPAEELRTTDFVVTDEHNRYVGVVSLRHASVRGDDAFLREAVMVVDVLKSVRAFKRTDNLRDAMAAMLNSDVDKIALVDDDNYVLGHVSTRDILFAYESFLRAPTAGAATLKVAPFDA